MGDGWMVGAMVLCTLACGGPGDNAKGRDAVAGGINYGAGRGRNRENGAATHLVSGHVADGGARRRSRHSYPSVIQRLANDARLGIDVINGGLSGETSAGALRRAEWLLTQRVAVLVIETGANDGLRGLDPDTTAGNITALIARARQPARGRHRPPADGSAPNLGPAYHAALSRAVRAGSGAAGVRLLPFLLDGVGGKPEFNGDDGIHPNPEGARQVAANVFKGCGRCWIRWNRTGVSSGCGGLGSGE